MQLSIPTSEPERGRFFRSMLWMLHDPSAAPFVDALKKTLIALDEGNRRVSGLEHEKYSGAAMLTADILRNIEGAERNIKAYSSAQATVEVMTS